uniref:Uncharacterized protein n=1 Tax=Knipowitschia caucasica TaxID=637954 RepID=A0AAV2L0D3_KNICA
MTRVRLSSTSTRRIVRALLRTRNGPEHFEKTVEAGRVNCCRSRGLGPCYFSERVRQKFGTRPCQMAS